ncbi:hypothetical protein PF008_g33433 [Phytophthora fragariae]|uniref:Uncharacterized protein n=1 Tax=Phytophthora fragariae TaxID=53985 RepID=A0A6G0PXF7_9STRA|nr:hypothetical protein PF008_g33433 [Phytophthora fragariae]
MSRASNGASVPVSKYLCNVVREGRQKTYFQIWHAEWSNGNDIPRQLLQEHKVRDCRPPTHPGKKRRRCTHARSEAISELGDATGAGDGGSGEEEAGENGDDDSAGEGTAINEL